MNKKWIRYGRRYSNPLWYIDWKLFEGKGRMIAYLDDASTFIVGYGLFPEATSEHSVEILKESTNKDEKPASILTYRGIQFYAGEEEEEREGPDRLREVSHIEREGRC